MWTCPDGVFGDLMLCGVCVCARFVMLSLTCQVIFIFVVLPYSVCVCVFVRLNFMRQIIFFIFHFSFLSFLI